MSEPNKQLWENSPLRNLFVDPETPTASGNGFFNAKDPNLAILHEKPEHRLMVMMKIRGVSNNEIAEACGFTVPWVSQVLRQPWAQKFMAEEMTKAGGNAVEKLLEGAAVDSVSTLIELRDDETTPKAVRRQSAVDLLDRYMGKPMQKTENTNVNVNVDVSTVEKIDAEIAELERQEKQLMGRN